MDHQNLQQKSGIHEQMVQIMVKKMEMVQALSLRQKNQIKSLQLFRSTYPCTTGYEKYDDEKIDVALKSCAPFTKCITQLNDKHIDTAEHIDITMFMYNLAEYRDNYSDTSRSLWQFKRDEWLVTDAGNPDNVITNNLPSLKCKLIMLEKAFAIGNNCVLKIQR